MRKYIDIDIYFYFYTDKRLSSEGGSENIGA